MNVIKSSSSNSHKIHVWTDAEIDLVRKGLRQYPDDTFFIQSVRIASTLPRRSIREVALFLKQQSKKGSRRHKPASGVKKMTAVKKNDIKVYDRQAQAILKDNLWILHQLESNLSSTRDVEKNFKLMQKFQQNYERVSISLLKMNAHMPALPVVPDLSLLLLHENNPTVVSTRSPSPLNMTIT